MDCRSDMSFTDFEQYFYRDPYVESITTGGHFELLDITDNEKKQTEEFIHVCRIFCNIVPNILS